MLLLYLNAFCSITCIIAPCRRIRKHICPQLLLMYHTQVISRVNCCSNEHFWNMMLVQWAGVVMKDKAKVPCRRSLVSFKLQWRMFHEGRCEVRWGLVLQCSRQNIVTRSLLSLCCLWCPSWLDSVSLSLCWSCIDTRHYLDGDGCALNASVKKRGSRNPRWKLSRS